MIFSQLTKKQKLFLLIASLIALIIGIIFVLTPHAAVAPAKDITQTFATFSNPLKSTFSLQIADTEATREKGLMNVTSLPKNEGMAFIFSESKLRTFWMKDTLIPLDIIFLNESVITQIYHNVPPCKSDPCPRYGSIVPSNLVIELNGNTAKTAQIKEQQRVNLKPSY